MLGEMTGPDRTGARHWKAPPSFPALLWSGAIRGATGADGSPALGVPDLGVLSLDPHGRRVVLDGQAVTLTAKEYLLTELLLTARGRLFGRDDILERVWGLDFPGDARIVDTYIKRLRGKLGAASIETVRGLGYRCPLSGAQEMAQSGVPQPHLQRLPPEARLLTRLAQRILQVSDPQHVIAEVYALLREQYGVRGVSLWSLPGQERLAHAGQDFALQEPVSAENGWTQSGWAADGSAALGGPLALIPLGSARPLERAQPAEAGQGNQEPWALLALWGGQPDRSGGNRACRTEWPLEVRSALDAVAGLVNPALRLNGEIRRREQAERELRSLNLDLEGRVRARTSELARVNADLAALYDLAQQLAGAVSLQQVLARGLSLLAGLAGASVCSLWRLRPSELNCLAAHSPAHHDLTRETQARAASLASLLRQSVACTSSLSVLTRTATLPGGRQVLLIPVAAGLPEVHALHLELPGELPADLGLIDAAARAFGLALERQMQTLMLEHAALSDELTGLPNRRALLGDLSAELSYSQRHHTSLTLSLFEIADIRAVNRRTGFAGGNDLIRALADGLGGTLRTEDRVYRLGGALLATLVRSVDVQESRALVARLDAHAWRFENSETGVSGAVAPGGAGQRLLRVSHVNAPDETAGLSDLLYLALERLGTSDLEPPEQDAAGWGLSELDASEPGACGTDLSEPNVSELDLSGGTLFPLRPSASGSALPGARLLDSPFSSPAVPGREGSPPNPPPKDPQP